MQTRAHHENIQGWGYDISPENRPGVPKQHDPPRPIGDRRAGVAAPQRTESASLVSPTRSMTPIYSSAGMPRGLSGVIRRLAYRFPEYKPRRWLMLMAADRVDAIEHNLPRALLFFGVIGALSAGLFALRPTGGARIHPI